MFDDVVYYVALGNSLPTMTEQDFKRYFNMPMPNVDIEVEYPKYYIHFFNERTDIEVPEDVMYFPDEDVRKSGVSVMELDDDILSTIDKYCKGGILGMDLLKNPKPLTIVYE